ncbi:unnamed protein product [Thelazia callipaeda]|uniref:C2H2-type domain-containing protein n=1 Tax=Thelazia callipaeda TaxID=103827 RepID=A0A0N5DB38_THECL|nr:unnamed protein product [Thelazia callipaeda]
MNAVKVPEQKRNSLSSSLSEAEKISRITTKSCQKVIRPEEIVESQEMNGLLELIKSEEIDKSQQVIDAREMEKSQKVDRFRETIKPSSLETSFTAEDVTSHVLSFKCFFCEAYIFTLQSFIIHLKSSHPNEDISEILSDQFRSCITSVEKEKIVVVTYAFPCRSADSHSNANHDRSSNSDVSICSQKSITSCCHSMEECEKKDSASADDALDIPTALSSTLHEFKADSSVSQEFVWQARSTQKPKTYLLSEHNLIDEEDSPLESVVTESSSKKSCDSSINMNFTLDEAKDQLGTVTSSLPAENTRRRQMSTYEKMMALTCQKCGQKLVFDFRFKNRCMLTRHAIEHKRANNPYRCSVEGCLDSYAEKRKLIGHLNYKHSELSKEEREAMLAKGDELMGKLRTVSLNGSLPCGSSPVPLTSSTVGTTGQSVPLTISPLTDLETVSISITMGDSRDSQSALAMAIPSASIGLLSTNHILKNMVNSVECEENEVLLKRIKREVPDCDESFPASHSTVASAGHNHLTVRNDQEKSEEISHLVNSSLLGVLSMIGKHHIKSEILETT